MDHKVGSPEHHITHVAESHCNMKNLYVALTNLSNALVMGIEQYLRLFDSRSAIPLLMNIVEKYFNDPLSGDVLTMCFRSLSLILEYVPSSYWDARDYHKSLLKLSFSLLRQVQRNKWSFKNTDTNALLEECLRVIRFVAKDDRTGAFLRVDYARDLALCSTNNLLARSALETLATLCSKAVMPPEFKKRTPILTFVSLFIQGKKSGSPSPRLQPQPSGDDDAVSIATGSTNPVVIAIENVLGSSLRKMAERFSLNLPHTPEVWGLLELALQCLSMLIERALLCKRPGTAGHLIDTDLPALLFKLIRQNEQTTVLSPNICNERILFCETVLAIVASRCSRFVMMGLVGLEAKEFFHDILSDADGETTTILDDPFSPGGVGGHTRMRSEKNHVTSIAAIYLLVQACPSIPSKACVGGKTKVVLPVHQWMWEDELRHPNQISEKQCARLDTCYTKGSRNLSISIHNKVLGVNLHSMTMGRNSSGWQCNITRRFTPYTFYLVDEAAVRPMAKPKKEDAQVKLIDNPRMVPFPLYRLSDNSEALPYGSIDSPWRDLKPSDKHDFSIMNDNQAVVDQTIDISELCLVIAEEYLVRLCNYAARVSEQVAKQVATSACAAILHGCFLADAMQQRVEVLMTTAMAPMCNMFRETFTYADTDTKAIGLAMMEWLMLHPMSQSWGFLETALRYGLMALLNTMSNTESAAVRKETDIEGSITDVAQQSALLVSELSRRMGINGSLTSPPSFPGNIHEVAMGADRDGNEDGGSEKAADTPQTSVMEILKCALHALHRITPTNTVHEFYSKDVGKSNVSEKAATASGCDCCLSQKEEMAVLRNLFAALRTSSPLTSYEVNQLDLASSVLKYLLGGNNIGDVFGPLLIFLSGASGSTGKPISLSKTADVMNNLGERHSPWAAVMNSGMEISNFLQLYCCEKRVRYFVECGKQCPEGVELLIRHLVRSLNLNNEFPLVESVLSFEKVTCKTPLQASEALENISPEVVLCAKASLAVSSAKRGVAPHNVTTETNATLKNTPNLYHPLTSSMWDLISHGDPYEDKPFNAKWFCMRGHWLGEVARDTQLCFCNYCTKMMQNGYICRICSFNICSKCHVQYLGNVSLLEALVKANDRSFIKGVHLMASIGDIERFFRTGTTSTKRMRIFSIVHFSLQHFYRFCTRTETFLARFTAAGDAPPSVLQVANLLRSNSSLLRREVRNLLSFLFKRSLLLDTSEHEKDTRDDGPLSPAPYSELSEKQTRIARELLHEALEERYILYHPFMCGPCPLQSTLLGLLYHQCVVTKNIQLLQQLENCLLNFGSATVPQKDEQLSATLMPNAAPASAAGTSATGAEQPEGDANFLKFGLKDKPFIDATDTRLRSRQIVFFHHFESDASSRCACGEFSRTHFASLEPRPLLLPMPALAQRADMLLLLYLHKFFCSPRTRAREDTAALDLSTKLEQRGAFFNMTIANTMIRAFHASALRVCVLPLRYAVPRWVNFILNHARFLVPARLRECMARFIAYGARRSLIMHLRQSKHYRFNHSIIVLPGEWSRMSDHKFCVDRAHFLRDAHRVLRKSAECRLPISIEFEGDVGVGQGPTAHFYTLLAREMSTARLNLWRNTELLNTSSPVPKKKTTPNAPSPAKMGKNPVMTLSFSSATSPKGNLAKTLFSPSSPQAYCPSFSLLMDAEPLILPPPEGLYPCSTSLQPSPVALSTPLGKRSSTEDQLKSRGGGALDSQRLVFAPTNVNRKESKSGRRDTKLQREKERFVDPRVVLWDYVYHQRERAKAFYALGAALGRAFLDEQVLPLHLSDALALFIREDVMPYSILLDTNFYVGKDVEHPVDFLDLSLNSLRLVDECVAQSLESLGKLSNTALQSLELFFTLPGDDSFELVPGGAKLRVNQKNLPRYQRCVVSAILYETISLPLRLITMGCHDVLPLEAFKVLEAFELLALLCGEDKCAEKPLWSESEICSVLVGDHGYQNDCPQLKMLGNILSKRLTPKEQRAFLVFCTGCPRLPLGGVRALGAITVVKSASAFEQNKDYAHAQVVPSVSKELAEEDAGGGDSYFALYHQRNGELDTPTQLSDTDLRTATCAGVVPSQSRKAAVSHGLPDDEAAMSLQAIEITLESEWALPSVNTCFRYLKIPPYPTEELMYKKLLISIMHSGDTFQLS